jgi:hypothetical protein
MKSPVKPTLLNCNLESTLRFLSRHAPDAQNPEFTVAIQRLISSWARLHQHEIVCDDQLRMAGTAFAVQDIHGRTCVMQTQRLTDTLEALGRNWQKYSALSEHDLISFMRRFEITSFSELDFGEPLLRLELALAAD